MIDALLVKISNFLYFVLGIIYWGLGACTSLAAHANPTDGEFNYDYFKAQPAPSVRCGAVDVELSQLLSRLRQPIRDLIKKRIGEAASKSIGLRDSTLLSYRAVKGRPIVRWVFYDFDEAPKNELDPYGVAVTVDACREKIVSTELIAW